jgi:hypothetical protein
MSWFQKAIIIVLFLTLNLSLWAGEEPYAVSKIPAELLKNADVVKRMEDIRFELVDIGKARHYVKYAITVLNEKGDEHASFEAYYDKLQSIESIEGTLYDANGKKVRSLKKSDLRDLSGTGGSSLMVDTRIKSHNFYCRLYPYTVEYEIEYRYNYTMFFPGWTPVEDYNYSVEQSRITVVCPADYVLRYKTLNYQGQPLIQAEKSNKSYTWEVKNIVAIENEYATPPFSELTSVLYLGPSAFKVEDYEGNMSSWQDFGKFVYALKQGRDELPDNIKQKVHELADPMMDPRDKIRVLYKFLQNNTRYISIQLGIGGWQPYDAKYVATKGYGDCKALANYMYSLLKEAGIKSYYTLAKAGDFRTDFISDFPSSQFNHVILCAPLQQDTVWLECTSQNLQAGYLSGFTSDRPVLLIDENGGILVRTPKYGLNENLQVRRIKATVDNSGLLSADINTTYKGIQQDDIFDRIHILAKDKLMEYLKKEIDLPQYDVSNFSYTEQKDRIPSIDENIEITAINYAAITGRRLFLTPNIISKSYYKPNPDETRKYPIQIRYEFQDLDSTEIKIPAGYVPETLPPELKLESKFGKYTESVKFLSDKIVYYRKMERYSGKFPATDYPELVKFYNQIYKADRSKIVLVKNE